VKRYGHQQPLTIFGDEWRHVTGHRPGYGNLAAIFETDGKAARQIVIGDSSARPRNPRRPREAGSTTRLLGRLQRQAAGDATRISKELHLLPAVGAKAVDVTDDDSASGATRR